jgi:drug/metabolite transporter (DMT)-like permease
MELWIPVTIAAAFLQNVRSALQKHLKGRLSTAGATYSRFCFAFPFAAIYVAGLALGADLPVPRPHLTFAVYCVMAGGTQILATALLVHLFSFRNFAVGTTYSKTETVQTAVFGMLILGDTIAGGAVLAILVSLAGVMAISLGQSRLTPAALLAGLAERTALTGIASGALFGISAVSFRGAALSLGGEGFVMQAAFTLLCGTGFQTLLMGGYLLAREPSQLWAVLRAWRIALWVGLSGMLASACWFTAMTIQNAAYVRALGQVELLFTFAAAVLFFRERINRVEAVGVVAVSSGILLLLLL